MNIDINNQLVRMILDNPEMEVIYLPASHLYDSDNQSICAGRAYNIEVDEYCILNDKFCISDGNILGEIEYMYDDGKTDVSDKFVENIYNFLESGGQIKRAIFVRVGWIKNKW